METVVIALEELAHYAESTARTMPVTGVVPRAVAEDQIRHALRALREKRRRLDASAPDGFAPRARGRASPRAAGCCSPPAAGA